MHGRKKSTQTASEAELQAISRKKTTFNTLVGLLFQRRNEFNFSDETLMLTEKLLLSCPDFATIWNYRREIIAHTFQDAHLKLPTVSLPQKISELEGSNSRDKELTLTAECIRKNPKSYGAWHHRLWIIQRFEVDFEKELELCKDFLKLDQRNFHCWNYRRSIVNIGCLSSQNEFSFSESKILENFSNYSAFHHRSSYITHIDKPISEVLSFELQIVENAIFTEPDDQSAWWYQQFLLKLTLGQDVTQDPSKLDWFIEILKSQLTVVSSLLEIESNCKWAMTSKVEIFRFLESVLRFKLTTGPGDDSSDIGIHEELKEISHQKNEVLLNLCLVDKAHINRYKYLQGHSLTI